MDSFDKNTTLTNIDKTYERIKDHILTTPLLKSKWLSGKTGKNVFMKMESEQISGSFKLRGATNKIFKLLESNKARYKTESIVTASSGNHGLACCYVTDKLGINLSVYVYNKIPSVKEDKLKSYSNVKVVKFGEGCCDAEIYARQQADENNLTFASPYNDIDIIYGQSTMAVEILKQLENVDTILVPVGGGGLISGVALYCKMMKPTIKIIGCQPVNDAYMYECIKAGKIVDDNIELDTIANGTAGKVEPGSITFDICQQFVDEWILLTEDEIERAVYDMFDKERKLVEGAAGLGVAGVQKYCSNMKDNDKVENIVIIICGCSIGTETMMKLFKKYQEPQE